MMAISEVCERFNAKKNGQGWNAKCPAHDDHDPSLGITEGDGGRILIRCRAGCDTGDVLRAVGLTWRDITPDKPKRHAGPGRLVERYPYTDESGDLLYEVCRYEPKTFRQRAPDGKGGWVWNLKGVKRVLYRLPEIRAAITEGKGIFITEGERDADSLRGLGIVATCNSGGAGKWQSGYSDSLRGAKVFILPDRDAPGRNHAALVRDALEGAAESVRVVELPDREGRTVKDATDWIGAGGTLEELRAIVRDAPDWIPPADGDGRKITSPANGEKGGRPKAEWTELANRFTNTLRDADGHLLVRFHRGQWLRYEGGAYRAVQRDDVRGSIMEWLRGESPKHAHTSGRECLMAHLQSADLGLIPSTLCLPAWDHGDGKFSDAGGWLAMKNGLVHVRNLARRINGDRVPEGEVFRPHTPTFLSTFKLDYPYVEDAICERWGDYITTSQSTAGADVCQKLAGLALIPETAYNAAFFLFGEGGTGKSVFMHVLRHLVGPSNCCCLPLIQFADKFSTFKLVENLLNLVADLPTEDMSGHGLKSTEGLFKDVCDGGLIPVERKHQEPTQAPAIARCVFATNSLPHFSDRSSAMWDRLRIIPFERRFRGTGEEKPLLRAEIVEHELPGVFVWAVHGLAALLAGDGRFPEHPDGRTAKERHRADCDPERRFLEAHYQRAASGSRVETKTIYDEFKSWMFDNGYSRRNAATFNAAVRRVFGIEPGRVRVMGERRVVFEGLEAKTDEEL